jgi:hypothetical protein
VQERVIPAFVCRLLALTCLARDIIEAMLDGRQSKGLRLAEMLGNAPLAWEEQRRALGLARLEIGSLAAELTSDLSFEERRKPPALKSRQ